MAVRDQSQKAGFVYTNIYELYKTAKNASASSLKSDARVWRAEELTGVKITRFEPRKLTPSSVDFASKPASPAAVPSAFDDLKGNIEKLQDLHSKLRFMLKELEDLVGKK